MNSPSSEISTGKFVLGNLKMKNQNQDLTLRLGLAELLLHALVLVLLV